jgi:glycosyltransferase involved in cell wall biosynthesis
VDDTHPLVSIVIPVFNRTRLLPRAIRSVLAQTCPDFELLIVDDGSDDDPAGAIETFSDPRIRLLRQDRANAAVARNTGILDARGRFVAFLDSDDEWLPTHLERRLRWLEADVADGVAGNYWIESEAGRRLRPMSEPGPAGIDDWLCRRNGTLATPTMCFRREPLLRVMFDPALSKHQDWDLGLRFAQQFRLAIDVEPTVIVHLDDEAGMSRRMHHASTAHFISKHGQRLDAECRAHLLFYFARMTWLIEGRSREYVGYLSEIERLGHAAGWRLYLQARLLKWPWVDRLIPTWRGLRKIWNDTVRSSASVRSDSPGEQGLALFMPGLAGGGAERVMLTLAEAFAHQGVMVDLVVCRKVGALVGEVPHGVRLVDLEAGRIIASLLPLVRYLRSARPAAMLVALAPTNCIATAARWLAGAGDMRLILAEHNSLTSSLKRSPDPRDRVLPLLMRLCYPRADAVIAVSTGVADDLAQGIGLDRRRIEVIYNPVVTPAFDARASGQPDSHWFDDGQPPVILSVGRLTAQKDFQTLIRAFARVRGKQCARLMILGEGEDRPHLESLVRKLGLVGDVAMPGFVADPLSYMRRSRAFVLSSRWEGLPTVLIEAMACGTPVISTDCPSGPSEILEAGRWGCLVPIGDDEAMAIAIDGVLRGGGPDARGRARQFSAESSIGRYRSILFPDGVSSFGAALQTDIRS